MNIPEMKFDKAGLIPAIVQDSRDGEVLMLAYMNREALEKTVSSGFAHFWSRSRNKMWKKGETSGHVQEVKAVFYDCDKDAVLVKVIQHGPGACHTGHRSCFFTDIHGKETAQKVFSEADVYGKK
ncbi:MAG: phosphoribosyl-AMP cyclohydrolase [Nitrospirota bacterium]|nr:phosphoribosyl-AMP cyclohydrolase [Nitrospirota bacterium]